jgi:glycosyltransferase involved in cell wall biosynthesis
MPPKVSVILPAYNAENWISLSIESILEQSFADFELLIIDDGSTDHTRSIVAGFSDTRIRLLENERNLGVAGTLNRGIGSAQGKYLARMDADDISMPLRLEKQVDFLDAHPDVSVVDTVMEYIDDAGQSQHEYNSDIISMEAIRKALPRTNCLGHSSIMMRRESMAAYPYRKIVYEDYDCWLRMAHDGHLFAKIDEPLLKYRRHDASITGLALLNKTHFLNLARTQRFYLGDQFFHRWNFSLFNAKVLVSMLYNYGLAWYKLLFRNPPKT